MASRLEELKREVYNAACKGDVNELRRLLEVRELVSSKTGTSTPLLAACFNGHTEVVRYLVDNCAVKMEEKNADGLTPLLLAADRGKADIVEYLIPIAESERTEKIDALELLGAGLVANNDLKSALMYWRLAMEERFRDGFDVIPKPVNQEPNAAYENAVEVATLDELNDDMISDPDAMQMQALLVRERILGPGNARTLCGIARCGLEYVARYSFERCLRLWTYALDMRRKRFEPLHRETSGLLKKFAKVFKLSLKTTRKPFTVGFDVTIQGVLEIAIDELQRGKAGAEYYSEVLLTTLTIIGIMCRMQERFSEQQVYKFKKAAYDFVKLDLRDHRGYTPLHLTCEENAHFRDFGFPSRDVCRLLIEAGASVNARSSHRQG